MRHINYLKDKKIVKFDEFKTKATGKYYTHNIISTGIFESIKSYIDKFPNSNLKIIDPFAGDGRLILGLLESLPDKSLNKFDFEIYFLDIEYKDNFSISKNINNLKKAKNINIKINIITKDSFNYLLKYNNYFDIIITNPPWEILKPDSRELKNLEQKVKIDYKINLKKYDDFLAKNYPKSQPKKKFAGWGTNLSRVGAELCFKICKDSGFIAMVIPASFFSDIQSEKIRNEFVKNGEFLQISYFPAESKLFGKADVISSSFLYKKENKQTSQSKVLIFNKELKVMSSNLIDIRKHNYKSTIPITINKKSLNILNKLQNKFPSWEKLENEHNEIWSGREIDETQILKRLSPKSDGLGFYKGRMIKRFQVLEDPKLFFKDKNFRIPKSCHFKRIAWRDVSRPTQHRRMISTIIPKNTIAGNSLNVVYYKDNDFKTLSSLLCVMNSVCFEFQIKSLLSTGHISLSTLRKTHLPNKNFLKSFNHLFDIESDKVDLKKYENKVEAIVAKKIFSLKKNELGILLNNFEKLTESDKQQILREYDYLDKENNYTAKKNTIFNHNKFKLSNLDLEIINSVPEGGNWKNIPSSIPSKRIKQIRKSYNEGKGSRSTYYGRLKASMPSYTINTYFNRPGNGCHIHYNQDRVLSQREAARLQSFPDNFIFYGNQNSINNQIGNAVPPLLSMQLAEQVKKFHGKAGIYLDLFAGAGGLSLGFKWSGWKTILANDIDKNFLKTYSENIHKNIIIGSIEDKKTFNLIVNETKKVLKKNPNKPFWILGGPPCQGFSTAGNKRTMKDKKNSLFRYYIKLVKELSPDGFIFENVSGLLSMENGRVFKKIKLEFNKVIKNVNGYIVNTENYGVPQRRKRVLIVGSNHINKNGFIPNHITSLSTNEGLFENLEKTPTVYEALSDLPVPSKNDFNSQYLFKPKNEYQKFLRGEISPKVYLRSFKN